MLDIAENDYKIESKKSLDPNNHLCFRQMPTDN